LQPGGEILTSDHEYGACDRTWTFVCRKSGAVYRHQAVGYPAGSAEEIAEQIWQGVNERTRLIFLSHITSPTALTLPVAEICARARQAGILTLIDGAHAPGQIDLDLQAVGADFYTGNCHKWMMAPKGAAFLYARREVQEMVEPLVVSWGWEPDANLPGSLKLPGSLLARFIEEQEWRGTDDPSACLAVPAAIDFMHRHDWVSLRPACHALVRQAISRIQELTGLPCAYQYERSYHMMAIAELPPQPDLPAFKTCLYEEYRVEAPCIEWNGRHFIRISVQGYNDQRDIDCLIDALRQMLRSQ
jgi:isopenicillin-N epimerase